MFDTNEAERLFAEAGVVFAGQIMKDFKQLIAFNLAISEERRGYLKEELDEVNADLEHVNVQLHDYGERRKQALSFSTSDNVFEKYKQLTNSIANTRADIAVLERTRAVLREQLSQRMISSMLYREFEDQKTDIETDNRTQHDNKDSMFSRVRRHLNEIVEQVINRNALLSVAINQLGHPEFEAVILDDAGRPTGADAGHTYKKLLCVAFDLALIRSRMDELFPRFVFHDGVFESLDDRKKENLMQVIREYCAIGVQHIVTLIDSDIPIATPKRFFEDSEVIVHLHDENTSGRLFKMEPW